MCFSLEVNNSTVDIVLSVAVLFRRDMIGSAADEPWIQFYNSSDGRNTVEKPAFARFRAFLRDPLPSDY